MRKFTALTSVLALGAMAFAANAQDATFGTGKIIYPESNYPITAETIQISWYNDDTETEFKLNPGSNGIVTVEFNGETHNAVAYVQGSNSEPGEPFDDETDDDTTGGTEGDGDIDTDMTGTVLTINLDQENAPWAWVEEETEWGTMYNFLTGTYTVTVPAGYLVATSSDDLTNGEFTDDITVYASAYFGNSVTVTPAAGESEYDMLSYPQTDLSEVTVSYGGEKITIIAAGETTDVVVYPCTKMGDDDWSWYQPAEEGTVLTATLNSDETALVFDLSSLDEGVYELSIPANYVLVGETINLSSSELWYQIFNGMQSATVITPHSAIVSTIEDVMFTWDYQDITEKTFSATLTYTNPDTYESTTVDVPASAFSMAYSAGESTGGDEPSTDDPNVEVPSMLADEDDSYNVLIVNIADLLSGSGQYTLSLAEGCVENGSGLVNPAQNYDFQVYALYENATIENTPSGLIEIVWNGVTMLSETSVDGTSLFIADSEGEHIDLPWNAVTVTNDLATVTINLRALNLADGKYTLTIPEGFATLLVEDGTDGDVRYMNAEQFFSFEMENGSTTGIEAIGVDSNLNNRIFNLQGVEMNANNLSNGIYIINGKKVVIRK